MEREVGGVLGPGDTRTPVLIYGKNPHTFSHSSIGKGSASNAGDPGLMHETGHSGPVHWDDPKVWVGEGGGRGFRMGNTCTPMADSCECVAKPPQYYKVIILQLK